MTIVYLIEQWDTASGSWFSFDAEEYRSEAEAREALATEKKAEPAFGGRFRVTATGETDDIDI